MENPAIVEPKAGVQPVETENQEAPPEAPAEEQAASQTASLPKELIKIPAIQGLIAGSPPALSASLQDFAKRGEAKTVADNKDALLKAGMGFYRSLDGQTGVVFNGLYVHPESLKQADQAGQLLQVAPPFDAVDQAVGKSGLAHPALSHPGTPPAAAPTAPVASPPQVSAAPMPASAQRKLATARVLNMQPGSPTSGGSPGAGRLLNAITKPVV